MLTSLQQPSPWPHLNVHPHCRPYINSTLLPSPAPGITNRSDPIGRKPLSNRELLWHIYSWLQVNWWHPRCRPLCLLACVVLGPCLQLGSTANQSKMTSGTNQCSSECLWGLTQRCAALHHV